MYYLTKPIEAFREIAKRATLTDTFFVLLSLWIAIWGLSLVNLVEFDYLSVTNLAYSFGDVTIMVLFLWFAISGAAYLLSDAASGHGTFRGFLAASGLAALPLVVAVILATLISLLLSLTGADPFLSLWISRTLVLIGLIIGTPGLYLVYAMRGALKTPPRTAALISGFLFLIVLLLIAAQSGRIAI